MVEELIAALKTYYDTITPTNFSTMLDGAKEIVVEYNEMGVSKHTIQSVLDYILINEGLTDHQEAILAEVLKCIDGYAEPEDNLVLLEWNQHLNDKQ